MQLKLNSNFYFINKPKTWTSQDLCTKFKKIYNFDKVGHSGTLDPNAEGAMLIATNKYTKLFDYISNKEKTYVVKSLFGYNSETLDIDSDFKTKILDILKASDDSRNKYMKIRQTVADSKVQDFTEMYSLLYDKVDEYASDKVSGVILVLAEGQHRDALAVDKEIPFMATILNILSTINK